MRDGRLLASLKEHQHYVGAVAFAPKGGGLITASHDAAFKRDFPGWSVGRTLYSNASIFEGVDSAAGLAWSPDGRFIAGSGMYGPVSITTLASGEVKELTGSKRATLHPPVAFSPDSRYVASSSGDGGLGIWNTSGLRLGVLKGWSDGPIAFSVDGRTLAQGGDDSVRLWSVPTFQRLITLPTGVKEAPGSHLADLIFTPDGSELVGLTLNGTVVRWRSVP
jgi:WD40 repeat protein